MKYNYYLLLIFLSVSFSSYGQEGVPCPIPPPPGAENCDASCVYCDINGYIGINNGTPSGGNTVCGQIALHNDQWFGYIAGSSSITFDIVATNCEQGNGLQVGIYDNCSDADALVCNPGCGECAGLALTLTYDNHTVGETYWLMIDGWTGDVCDFEIIVADGSAQPPVPEEPLKPNGPTSICPGGTAVYTIPPAFGSSYYHWTAPQGASINGLGNGVNLPDTQVTITFGSTGGQVCVQAGNACAALSAEKCLNVTLNGIPPTIKPLLEVCYEDLPYTWDEDPFTTLTLPGTYTLTSSPYSSQFGCDSVVKQTIKVLQPGPVVVLPPRVRCAGDCFEIGGLFFCESGTFSVALTSYRGCDSTVQFTLVFVNPVAEITGSTQLLCEQDSLTLNSLASMGDKTWQDTSGNVLAMGDSLVVKAPGVYILSTTYSNFGVTCFKSDTVVVTEQPNLIGVDIEGASQGCGLDSLMLQCMVTVAQGQFVWSGPGGYNSTAQNPVIHTPGIYTVEVGTETGCYGTDTITINDFGVFPDVTAVGDILNCANPVGQLDGGSTTPGATYSWLGPNGFSSFEQDPVVQVAGEYVLTVTGLNGCSSTASVNLSIDITAPGIELPDSARIICQAYPSLMCNTNASNPTFAWAGPGNFVSTEQQPQTLAAGTYTVTVTDNSNGCTASQAIEVYQDDPITFIETDTIIHPTTGQNNGSIAITPWDSPGTFTFQWTLNGALIAETEDVMNLGPGTYVVVAIDSFGCVLVSTYILEAVSATDDLSFNGQWQVQPNPSAGKFSLRYDGRYTEAPTFSVYEPTGRLVLEQKGAADQQVTWLDLGTAPNGVYLLKIMDAQRHKWLRLVVQR